MRKWFTVVSAIGLILAAGAGVSSGAASAEGHRIVLQAGHASRAGLAVRHALGGDMVSAHVSDAQLATLTRQGVSFDVVPQRSIAAAPSGKGKTSTRPQPATQVPYGIKMVYGNPSLAPGGVAGGAGVKVAILDTGSVNHPDFTRGDGTQVIVDCVDFSSAKTDMVQGTCTDGNGHGTHVTGTVAAAGGLDGQGIYGVAPEAAVLSYKVLTNRGNGYADDIARAITWAADHGANIISMSLGSTAPFPIELDAIRYAVGKGVLVVASAGNSGPDADTLTYPAAYAEVVAVAALSADEAVSSFSSRGWTDGDDASIVDREVEVAAPGRGILSTNRDGAYVTMSGTSMAAPHIAGLAAKRWAGSASATRAWLRTAAGQHDIVRAEQVSNAGVGYDIAAGYGLPQVQGLTQSLWRD